MLTTIERRILVVKTFRLDCFGLHNVFMSEFTRGTHNQQPTNGGRRERKLDTFLGVKYFRSSFAQSRQSTLLSTRTYRRLHKMAACSHAALFHSKLTPWFESLKNGSSPVAYMPPLPAEATSALVRIRGVNQELLEQKDLEEKRKEERLKAEEEGVAVPEVVEEAAAESDDEEIPLASAQAHHSTKLTLFMPSKKADADESLFTKFA